MAINRRILEFLGFLNPQTLSMILVGILVATCAAPVLILGFVLFGVYLGLCKGERREELRVLRKQRFARQSERNMRPMRAQRVSELLAQFPGLLEHVRSYDNHRALIAGREATMYVDDEAFAAMAKVLRPERIVTARFENLECYSMRFSAGDGVEVEAHPSIWVQSPIFDLPRNPRSEVDRGYGVWIMHWSA